MLGAEVVLLEADLGRAETGFTDRLGELLLRVVDIGFVEPDILDPRIATREAVSRPA